MTVFEGLSCLGGAATLIIAIAALGPENRAWAKKQTMSLLATMLYVTITGTGIAGIIMFGAADGPPTRMQILLLVMQLFNFFMGIKLLVDAIFERRLKPSRDALAKVRAEAMVMMETHQKAETSSVKKSSD